MVSGVSKKCCFELPSIIYICQSYIYSLSSWILFFYLFWKHTGGPMVTVSMAPSTGLILSTEMISKMSIHAFEETMKLSQDGCQQIYETFKAGTCFYKLLSIYSQ